MRAASKQLWSQEGLSRLTDSWSDYFLFDAILSYQSPFDAISRSQERAIIHCRGGIGSVTRPGGPGRPGCPLPIGTAPFYSQNGSGVSFRPDVAPSASYIEEGVSQVSIGRQPRKRLHDTRHPEN